MQFKTWHWFDRKFNRQDLALDMDLCPYFEFNRVTQDCSCKLHAWLVSVDAQCPTHGNGDTVEQTNPMGEDIVAAR